MFAFKKAVEAAGSKETDPVIQALEGMVLASPAGDRSLQEGRPPGHVRRAVGPDRLESQVSL